MLAAKQLKRERDGRCASLEATLLVWVLAFAHDAEALQHARFVEAHLVHGLRRVVGRQRFGEDQGAGRVAEHGLPRNRPARVAARGAHKKLRGWFVRSGRRSCFFAQRGRASERARSTGEAGTAAAAHCDSSESRDTSEPGAAVGSNGAPPQLPPKRDQLSFVYSQAKTVNITAFPTIVA
jgi:hypothetical protein